MQKKEKHQEREKKDEGRLDYVRNVSKMLVSQKIMNDTVRKEIEWEM